MTHKIYSCHNLSPISFLSSDDGKMQYLYIHPYPTHAFLSPPFFPATQHPYESPGSQIPECPHTKCFRNPKLLNTTFLYPNPHNNELPHTYL